MSKKSSRREFLKLGAFATGAAMVLSAKKSSAKSMENVQNETLYKETEHFKQYYETLR
jgi:hypothetical protein